MSEGAPPLSPGQRLKAERERRGMSTQKAADEMHLDSWVIEALEADDYPRIGPTVYAKGHLKKYASILGLPAAEILSAFGANVPPAAPRVAAPSSVRLPTAPAAKELPWPAARGRRAGRVARRRCFLVAPLAPALRGAAQPRCEQLADGRPVSCGDAIPARRRSAG